MVVRFKGEIAKNCLRLAVTIAIIICGGTQFHARHSIELKDNILKSLNDGICYLNNNMFYFIISHNMRNKLFHIVFIVNLPKRLLGLFYRREQSLYFVGFFSHNIIDADIDPNNNIIITFMYII